MWPRGTSHLAIFLLLFIIMIYNIYNYYFNFIRKLKINQKLPQEDYSLWQNEDIPNENE